MCFLREELIDIFALLCGMPQQSKKKRVPSLDQNKLQTYGKGTLVIAFEFCESELGAEQELGAEWSWEEEREL